MVDCTKCRKPLTEDVFNVPGLSRCPSCRVPIHVDVFPALYRPVEPESAGETFLFDGEAGCFYHPNKKAVIPCSSCGRFLCALCDVELNDRHLCPACLEKGKRDHKIKDLDNHRTLYDHAALSLAVVPMLIFYITVITAPLVIFMTIRYWKAPSSIIPRTKVRFVVAAIIAVLQIAGWTAVIYSVSTS